ncbi:phage holin family protein [Gracilibacillus sp. D59]|uniref:phage holin family protein n=1 Tax=Gracilibacillus sp. D59 TaxID=3457434 RepID=UPI003FCD15AB
MFVLLVAPRSAPYARKLLILVVIILANVVDQILGLNGAVTYATLLFYIAGSNTISALQNYFDTVVDSKLSRPSLVVKELQRRLNEGTF